ncbi:ribose-phosphate diphosphokinase [bacterium]|nr:ribose-phosphate diphosphokinase [bacterium]
MPRAGALKIDKFSDGEILPLFRESVRDEDVFFINSTTSSDAIVETLLVVDAAKRAGCKSFTLIAPYQGYSRQDKTDHLRSSIGSKLIADIMEKAGVTRLVTIDLHSSSIQGFYNIPVIHLNGNKIFLDYINNLHLDNLCIVSPDQGAVKRAGDFCKAFPNASFAMINKKRVRPNEVHSMELVGDVKGKNVILVDDMADTSGTMKKASILLKQNGALSVRAIATHGILSGDALRNIEESELEEMIVSDTIETTLEKSNLCEKLRVVSCDKLISSFMMALEQRKSIHEINVI